MKIDGIVVGGQNVNLTNLSDIFSRLNVGDVLKAQILEFTSGELLLKLYDGTTLTAATQTPIDAKKGDFVDFSVKGKNDNQLVLETVRNEDKKPAGIESELKKQLVLSDIKPDSKNMDIAKALNQNQLPVNKEIFSKVADFLLKFKDLTPDKAAFLTANQFKIEEKNVKALNQLVDAKAKLDSSLNDILNSLKNIKDSNVLKRIEENLTKFKSPQIDKQPNKEEISTGNIEHQNVSTEISKALENKTSGIQNLINKEMVAPNNTILKKLSEGLDIKDIGKLIKIANADKNEVQQGVDNFLRSNIKNFDDMTTQEQNILKNALTNIIIKIKQGNTYVENDNIENAILKDADIYDTNKLDNILHKTFERFAVKIQSENLDKDLHVQRLYKDVYERLEVIKESIVSSVITNKDDLIQKIDQLQNNIRFINELNNHSTYIQIPLNMFNKHTTGELYILKRDPKKKKIDPENVTMLVSLNTEYIGRIDSLISLNKKNIGLNIRVENKDIQSFVKENHDELYNRLKEKGYKLVDLKCRIVENEPDILNAQGIMKKELERNRVAIDYKI